MTTRLGTQKKHTNFCIPLKLQKIFCCRIFSGVMEKEHWPEIGEAFLHKEFNYFNTTYLFLVAPIKALCSERYEDWNNKFSKFGLKCTEMTGDTELDDFQELQMSHIVFTTPVSGPNIQEFLPNFASNTKQI